MSPARSDSSSSSTLNSSATSPFALLTESQNQAFSKLKDLVESNDEYWPPTNEGISNITEINDLTLLRYLRARQYDPEAAFKQYTTTGAWRRNLKIDSYYDNSSISNFEATRRLFPQWTGRRSKTGIPIFIYQVSGVKTDDLLTTSKADPELKSIFLPAEHSVNFIMPLCATMHPAGVVNSSVNVIDLSGVGVRHFWNLRSHLQKASQMATSHYPETVDQIFIVGAPGFFPTIWGFITKWFDPATTSKIQILSASAVTSTLAKYIAIEDLPRRFGGEMEWEYGNQPSPDAELQELLGEKMKESWLEGPMRYVETPSSSLILALGTEDGKARKEILASNPGQKLKTYGETTAKEDDM